MPAVRKTTDQQLRMLLDFMGRNVEIAHAKVPHHGKAVMNAKWNELAHKLNAIGPAKPPVYWRHVSVPCLHVYSDAAHCAIKPNLCQFVGTCRYLKVCLQGDVRCTIQILKQVCAGQ